MKKFFTTLMLLVPLVGISVGCTEEAGEDTTTPAPSTTPDTTADPGATTDPAAATDPAAEPSATSPE